MSVLVDTLSGTPVGAFCVGIDAASNLVGLAAIDEAGQLITRELDAKDGLTVIERRSPLRRMVWLCDQTAAWLRDIHEHGVWCCCLEQPSTRHGGAVLLGAFGALGMTAQRVMPEVVVHEIVPARLDELAGVQRRRLPTAPSARESRKLATSRRAAELGYLGDSQDVADAVVAAQAARVLTAHEMGWDLAA